MSYVLKIIDGLKYGNTIPTGCEIRDQFNLYNHARHTVCSKRFKRYLLKYFNI